MATKLDWSIFCSGQGRLLSSDEWAELFYLFHPDGEYGSHVVHEVHEEFYYALADCEHLQFIHSGTTAPPDVIEKVTKATKLAKQVLDRHWEDWSYAYHPSFALKKVAEDAKEFLLRQEEQELKFLFGDLFKIRGYASCVKKWDASQPSTKPFPRRCPSNVSSSKLYSGEIQWAGDYESPVPVREFDDAYAAYVNQKFIQKFIFGGTEPPGETEALTKLAKQVLELYRDAGDPSFALKISAENAMIFFRHQMEKWSKSYGGDPSNFREYLSSVKNWDASQPSTKPFPSRCPSNVSSSKATRADTIIDIPNEVHNHGDALPTPNVWFGASASSSSHSVFAQDWSSPSSILLQDMPSGPHFDQPGTSNVRATTSGKLDDASASEASNEANARFEMHDDSDSEASNGQAIAGSEIHNRDIDNDHSAWTEIIRAREAKFLIEFNAVIAAVTGAAVFNLIGSTSTDSPFVRCCAATAGIGFFGSLFAICFTRNQKVAKVLSKIGAIGAVFAVSFGLGITVLKDTEWYVNLVATGIACLLSSGVIAMADI